MKGFLKYFLASFLAVCVALLVLTLIGLGSLSALISAAPDEVKIKPGTVLVLDLEGRVTERTIDNPMETFDYRSFKMETSIGLTDIILNLAKAEKDPNIAGLLVKTGMTSPGISTLDEIRESLIRFKESGKFIIASSDNFSQGGYYVATVADGIYMNPEGLLELRGLRSDVIFYKKALEKIGVDIQVVREGKYKSAVEPFSLESMSEASKEQVSAYLTIVWNRMLAGISQTRGIPVDELNRLADEWAIRTSREAVEKGLIDSLMYEDQVLDLVKARSQIAASEKLRTVTMSQYTRVADPVRQGYSPDRIAIVYGTGSISKESSGNQGIGKELARTFARVRKDNKVKAVVFRINSPGGDALASEVIRREVELTAAAKPVIVSMGNVAGSGGYWIATPGRKIVAGHTSLTGSIGVFGMVPNLGKLLTDKIGITFDGVQTNKLSDAGSFYRAMTTEETAVLKDWLNHTYDRFLDIVSQTRKMTKEEVDRVGQGRIWAGIDAKAAGLVDEIGGLHEAIKLAASEAGLENYRIRELPLLKNPVNEIINSLLGKGSPQETLLARQLPVIRDLQEIIEGGQVQARVPFRIDIR